MPGLLGYTTVALSYLPRPDGAVLTESPDKLGLSGRYAKVPFIVGDQEDEGTLFSLFTPNITTTEDITNYLQTYFFNQATKQQISSYVATYQNTIEDGSPFRTGIFNNIYPQFKRMAAILGDMTFTLTRRVFLEAATAMNPTVPSWSYLATYDYGTPVLGTFHGSDLLQVFYGIYPNDAARTIRGYYFNFVYDLDPNKGNQFGYWPQWSQGKQLMQFGLNGRNSLLKDDFRQDSATFLAQNVESLKV